MKEGISPPTVRRRVSPRKNSSKGFTTLEVMVSLLLVSVALLGQASMLTTAVKMNKGAGFRMEATLLAAELSERMENNRAAANTGAYVVTPATSTVPSVAKDCSTSTCTTTELASFDLATWAASASANLPGAKWEVKRAGTPVTYTITLSWQERRDNARRVTYESAGDLETASLAVTKVISP
jgi:type IV pilus assembly protein PilV